MLPKAVREQAERAESLHQEYLNRNTAPAAPVEPVATAPETQPEKVEAAPEPVVQQDSWELKYKVLQGKYGAEVPRLAAENRSLREEIEALKKQSEVAQAPAPSDTALADVREKYGDEFAEAVEVIATAKAKAIRDEIAPRMQEVAQATSKQLRAAFISELRSFVPDFAVIDADPGFTSYLDEFDPMTGRARREFFNEADAANDANRVAVFFRDYLRSKTPAVATATPARPSADALLVPSSSRASEAPPGKKLWTQSEIQQFYREARPTGASSPHGRFTAQEFAAIDADITAAGREGRIRR